MPDPQPICFPFFATWAASVSYTHLDVYKRQVRKFNLHEKRCVVPFAILAFDGGNTLCFPQPISLSTRAQATPAIAT